MSEVAPLFIVSCGRSGTTLLRLMLNRSSELYVPHESGFIMTLYERRQDYGDLSSAMQRAFFIRDLQLNDATRKTKTFPIFELTTQQVEQALQRAAPTNYAGAVDSLFRAAAANKGKHRWADKTPIQVTQISELRQLFPESRFLHVIRDARDVAASLLRVGWFPDASSAAKVWTERVRSGRQAGQELGPQAYKELLYEDLVTDPAATMRALCEWMDLPFEEAMLEPERDGLKDIPEKHHEIHAQVSRPINTSRLSSWRKDLSKDKVADIERHAGDLLEELGYELSGVRPTIIKRALRHAIHSSEPRLRRAFAAVKRL